MRTESVESVRRQEPLRREEVRHGNRRMTVRTLFEPASLPRGLWSVLSFTMLTLLAGGCERQAPSSAPAASHPPASVSDTAQVDRFIEQHWARPLAPQGTPPVALKAQGITLAPESCANCHAQQFNDWRMSLHSRAMGPGIMGQLVTMPAHAKSEHQSCIRCHAPLAEQADSLAEALGKNTKHVPSASRLLRPPHEQGLTCAACHVRNYEWNGPPRRDGSQAGGDLSALPHRGWKANSAFESAQFCAACHQFKADEFALNGKLLENTYREWEGSRFARQGTACQSCHMPDRRHLWRGIHDPEMVKKGIDIQVGDATTHGNELAARMRVANTGVGHYFPTYVTPKVVLRAYQEDGAGRKLAGTTQEYVIGRQVSLDLSREIADTRIAPDNAAVFDYRAAPHPDAAALVFEVEVHPDAFYLEFYLALLQDDAMSGESRRLIVEARDHTLASPYLLFSRRQPLSP